MCDDTPYRKCHSMFKSENTDHKARLQPCAQTQFTEQILFNEATF